MRVNLFLTATLAATALLVASCSTQKLAQNNSADDVYNTVAQAKVYKYAPPAQTAQIDTSRVDPSYQASNPNYDMDYASRIDRFYYGSPNRVYFDDYYNFYGYNYWYNPLGVNLGYNYGWAFNRFSPFNYWGYYWDPYFFNTWGPYSYYNFYGAGYYGGGYWGNGGWGGGVVVRNDNYRPRPTRGVDNARPAGRFGSDIPSRGNANVGSRPTRPESYNPTTNGTVRRPESTTGSSSGRPTRGESSRPSTPPRESYTPPRTYTPPPSNTSGSGSSGSGSSSSGGSRPTRGGGRG